MNFVTKLGVALAVAATLAAPASALAYYPYTYFTGTNYFNAGGGFNVQQPNYYGSSNCNSIYGCGTIGYNAMTGQWSNGGLMGGYGYGGYGYGSQMGYGSYSGAYANSGGNSFNYMQYVPAHVQQYVGGYGNYGGYGYGGGYGGYVY